MFHITSTTGAIKRRLYSYIMICLILSCGSKNYVRAINNEYMMQRYVHSKACPLAWCKFQDIIHKLMWWTLLSRCQSLSSPIWDLARVLLVIFYSIVVELFMCTNHFGRLVIKIRHHLLYIMQMALSGILKIKNMLI